MLGWVAFKEECKVTLKGRTLNVLLFGNYSHFCTAHIKWLSMTSDTTRTFLICLFQYYVLSSCRELNLLVAITWPFSNCKLSNISIYFYQIFFQAQWHCGLFNLFSFKENMRQHVPINKTFVWNFQNSKNNLPYLLKNHQEQSSLVSFLFLSFVHSFCLL